MSLSLFKVHKMNVIVFCFFNLALVLQAQSFLPEIPNVVQPFFKAAWDLIEKMYGKGVSIDEIDIHKIPFGEEVLCDACCLTFDFLLASHKYYVPDHVLKKAMAKMCSLIYTEQVCQGIVELNVPIFLEIAKRKPDLNSFDICGTIFEQYCAKEPVIEWSLPIPKKKQYRKNFNYLARTNYGVEEADTVQIAHVTDTHVDRQYTAGAVGVGCREPICCRGYQGRAKSADDAAGRWGNYASCDIPWHTVNNTLTTIAANHKNIKYVYMTGDLIAHNLWETSEEVNTKQIQQQARFFKKIFGADKIFPVMGNHEPHPANVLIPPDMDIPGYSGDWLYEAFYNSWCDHFPPETRTTFMRGGFYTVSPEPGFRIIGLNSLFGYVYNWWMILDPVDPGGMLAWLIDVLLVAERNHEKVHILMHAPSPENDTLHVWSREYHKIIHRFQDTVAGQFVGHTHRDQFYLFYNKETFSKPFSVAWNGGSITTFTNVNPNYKIYTVNKLTKEVEDIDTYVYNLTEANQNWDYGSSIGPQWFKLYSFKDAYNISSLQLQDLNGLAKKMSVDKSIFRKYFLYYLKNSDVAYKKRCGLYCKLKNLCTIISNRNRAQCEFILST